MAYNERAAALRRCRATRQDGEPCRAFAIWGTQRCAAHTYQRRGKALPQHRYRGMPTKAEPCTCVAYAWPHRPGGGLCNWPDPPRYRSTIPVGTHGSIRAARQQYRQMMRRWRG